MKQLQKQKSEEYLKFIIFQISLHLNSRYNKSI